MNWGWYISALFYEVAYSKLMHDIDGYTLGFLAHADKLENSRILDVGAGTGNIDFKLIDAGARKVVSIENNPAMLWRLNAKRKKKQVYFEKTEIKPDDMYSGIIKELGNQERFDVELFRRCLYKEKHLVTEILEQGFDCLHDDGIMFIVHPERDKNRYLDNGFGGIALSHFLKWHISEVGKRIAIDYHRYTQEELVSICKDACRDSCIQVYSPLRPAYNIITVIKR